MALQNVLECVSYGRQDKWQHQYRRTLRVAVPLADLCDWRLLGKFAVVPGDVRT